MKCDNTLFSSHAITRMFDRELSKSDVIEAIRNGETLSDYPDDQPYPSKLLLGIIKEKPIHIVVARNKISYSCYVITAYSPSLKLWHADFKTRKQQ